MELLLELFNFVIYELNGNFMTLFSQIARGLSTVCEFLHHSLCISRIMIQFYGALETRACKMKNEFNFTSGI